MTLHSYGTCAPKETGITTDPRMCCVEARTTRSAARPNLDDAAQVAGSLLGGQLELGN